jgi:hypothetical protein
LILFGPFAQGGEVRDYQTDIVFTAFPVYHGVFDVMVQLDVLFNGCGEYILAVSMLESLLGSI